MTSSVYPGAPDTFTNPTPANTMDGDNGGPAVQHATQHTLINDAVAAVETTVGNTGAFNFANNLVTQAIVTASTISPAPNTFTPLDTTSNAITVTLPTAPVNNTRISLKVVKPTGATTLVHAVTYATGGSDVINRVGGPTSGTLTLLSQAVTLQYQSSTAIWYVVADDLPLSSLSDTFLASANNLSDVADAGTSRANLHVPTLGDCQTASATNINIASPGATISSYAFVSSGHDQVLLFGQTTASQNGPWVWNGATAPLTRPTDFFSGLVLNLGKSVRIEQGTYAGQQYNLTASTGSPVTVDTTAQTWTLAFNVNSFVQRAAGTSPQTAPLPFLNVKDYGAVGDGVTDDTAAVQAALNAAGTLAAVLGSVVRVTGAAGAIYHCTYGTTVGLVGFGNNLAALVIPSEVSVEGMSFDFPTYPGGTTAVSGFSSNGSTNWAIRNCTLEGNGEAGMVEEFHYAIFFGTKNGTSPQPTVTNVVIEGCTFKGWLHGPATSIGDSVSVFPSGIIYRDNFVFTCVHAFEFGGGISGGQIVNNYIANPLIPNSGAEVIIVDGDGTPATVTDVLIADNTILGWSQGITVNAGTDIIVSDNLIDALLNATVTTQNLIFLNSFIRLTISGNISKCGSKTGAPISTALAVGQGTPSAVSQDIVIVNNYIDNVELTAAGNALGIAVVGTSTFPVNNVLIQGNHVYIGEGKVLRLDSCHGVQILDNVLSASLSTQQQIEFFDGLCTGVIFSRNTTSGGIHVTTTGDPWPVNSIITDNSINVTATGATTIMTVSSGCIVTGNQMVALTNKTAIAEVTGATGGVYANNVFNYSNPAITFATGSTSRASGNEGWNPRGHTVAQPAVPATTVAQQNTTGVDCSVFVNGGTVTVVAIGGTTTGQTAGSFRVPAGQTITLTYSAAPTWQWFGD